MSSDPSSEMSPESLPDCWRDALRAEFEQPYFERLADFVANERKIAQVFPAAGDVFQALQRTPLNSVRAVILGQDPYHDDGQAHGLSFSVLPGVKLPPSLRNIFKELHLDLGITPAKDGCLNSWADQGVLLLNTVLTVRAHEANSHRGHGWEEFTTCVLQCVNEQPHVAFVLWGKSAESKASLIDRRHRIITGPHPSPLSAHRGFFGSRPFSAVNQFLQSVGHQTIDWQLKPN